MPRRIARVIALVLPSLGMLACDGESPEDEHNPSRAEATGVQVVDDLGAGPEDPKRSKRPAPRTCVIESLVVFLGAPEHPQRMIATFAGPERARLWFGTLKKDSPERRLVYRDVNRVFGVDPGSSESREVDESEAQSIIAQFELRRAAYLWPEGFEWKADGSSYVAPLANGLGSLRASFEQPVAEFVSDEGSLPTSFQSELAENVVFERYSDLIWNDSNRLTGLQLHAGERPIWNETLESFDARARFVSSYFVPADRRTGSSGLGEAMVEGAVRVELPARSVIRIPITSTTLAEARVRAPKERANWKGALQPGYAIEFDADLHQAQALLFWPAAESEDPVPGTTRTVRPERAAVALLLTRQELSEAAQSLPQLRAQFPPGAKPGPNYEIHFGEGDAELGDDRAQLVWSYEGT